MKSRQQILDMLKGMSVGKEYVPFIHGAHSALMWSLGYNPEFDKEVELRKAGEL